MTENRESVDDADPLHLETEELSELGYDKRVEEAAGAVDAIFRREDAPDFEDIAGPTHWPRLTAKEAEGEWPKLRTWVEHLLCRFPHLDHHTIPMCWWRHNGHVEALAALRDHERMCYSDGAPSTAGVEWHRAFRDIEARLREWTSNLACGAIHDPRTGPERNMDERDWRALVSTDVQRRRPGADDHGTKDGNR